MAARTFAMPDLGEGLEEARIVEWLVSEGDAVDLNQPLVEVETVKASVEIPSPYAGVVASLHAGVGDNVSVGAVLVTFSEVEVAADGVGGGGGSAGQSPPNPRSATAAPLPPSGGVVPRPISGAVAATPAVRRLANDLGVDLGSVTGTGPGGRVTAEDVRSRAAVGSSAGAEGDAEAIPVTAIRRAIADNLSQHAASPRVTTFRTVDCTELQAFRRELAVSPLPVFVAALCRVIAAHPLLNASWTDDAILAHHSVRAGIATDTERGLVVPVVSDAQSRGIAGLAGEIRRLADAARSGSLTPADVERPTIGVTNTGSYGSEAGTPLLTPGCAVTIALGVISPRALVVEGRVVARDACTVSLTFDHRVLDGAATGRGLTDLVQILTSPERLRDLPR